ncbi:MAG: hypothetical protein OXC68_04795 [Aestuariivita sp.]|nr:hypothetical protein [Aestuariivita sp.]
MIGTIEGVIVMMSPSRRHEDLAVASDDVVSASASVLNLAINKKRGTRWKAPDDSHNSGLEADAAFYIGKNAVDYYTAFNN